MKSGAGLTDNAIIDVAEFFERDELPQPSTYASAIGGSQILQIAGDIREMLEAGEDVANLTVGDFRPDQFPVPAELTERIIEAHRAGETNYPPVAGVKELREAVRDLIRDDLALDYPIESILIAGGARPLLFSSFMALVDPGDTVLYPVPSWNNHFYVQMSAAEGVPLAVRADKNFHIDRTDLEPYLSKARLLCLNSPLNPTGTCISESALAGICEAIVAENDRRRGTGARPFFLVYDQVYNTLTFGDATHCTPVGLVPDIAPYTIMIDAVSKGLSGTGLRVGWCAGPPSLVKKMTSMAGHHGAWAPRPEQIGVARFLRDGAALAAHRREMIDKLHTRLDKLDAGFSRMRETGLPVEHIAPQGAIYLSVRFDLVGKTVAGQPIRSNEDLRILLLREAGFAVIPFEAFGLPGDDGWVRLSVGAVSEDEIDRGLARVQRLFERVEG